MENRYIKKYNLKGELEIHLDEVVKDWDNRWCLSQWNEEFTLIKYKGKNQIEIKVRISNKDAFELIQSCHLVEEKSQVFKSGSTWRKKGVIDSWLEKNGDPVVEEVIKVQLYIVEKLNELKVTDSQLAYDIGTTQYNALSILSGQYRLTLEDIIKIKYKYKIEYEY